MSGFDDFGKVMDDFVQTTVQKTKELAAVTKLNARIIGKESDLKSCYTELGRLCHEGGSVPAGAEQVFTRASELKAELAALREEVKRAQGKGEPAEAKAQPDPNVCADCGTQLDPQDVYCRKCGKKRD